MAIMYVYIKDGEIVSNPLVPISKEADRIVELEFDDSQRGYLLSLDVNGDPTITYYDDEVSSGVGTTS